MLHFLTLPLAVLGLFFIGSTLLAYLSQGVEEYRLLGINLKRIVELLDLREENTLATWFSSVLILLNALALGLLATGHNVNYQISTLSRTLLQLATLGAVLLSADEVGSVHETIGKMAGRVLSEGGDSHGFAWVILFAPILLTGFILLVRILWQLLAQIPADNPVRRLATASLWVALITLPSVFILEGLEAYMVSHGIAPTLLRVLEESLEIIGMWYLFLCLMLLGRYYRL